MSAKIDNCYVPLTSSRSIRLISLADTSAATSAVRLNVSLRQANLDDLPPWSSYTAFSYVWGQNPTLVEIGCDGNVIHIPPNLHRALTKVWHITPRQLIWADAICIDQQSATEKSVQVQLMGDIYRKADSVLVWLGDPNDEADGPMLSPKSSRRDQTRYFLQGLGSSSWLRRLWTLQEIVLATNAVVLYGDHWIAWRELAKSLLSTRFKEEAYGVVRPQLNLIERYRIQESLPLTLLNQDHAMLGAQKLHLSDLIVETRARQCADSHDKIYALLALLPNGTQYFSPVDYGQPVWALFARATALSLMFDQKTDLLSIGGLDQRPPRNRSWPSWVPDLTATRLLDLVKSHQERTPVQTVPQSASTITNCFDWDSSNPATLRMRAWIMGIVLDDSRDVSPASPYTGSQALCAFPSCCLLSQNLRDILKPKNEPGISSSKQTKAVFARDLAIQLDSHRSGTCSCQEAEMPDPRSLNAFGSSKIGIIGSLYNEQPNWELNPGDWICEIPISNGLCVLRPSLSGQFQLVGASSHFNDLARHLMQRVLVDRGIVTRRQRQSPGTPIPTTIASFEIV